jgi:hypothetical protein
LFQVLKFDDGSAIGHWEGQLSDRLVSDAEQVRILELRHGMIRAQALSPRESVEFIDKLLGET